MDRRAFFAAFGGLLASGAVAKAQTAGLVGDVLGIPGDVLGLGAGVVGGIVPGGGFRLADLQGGEYSIETSRLALERGSRPVRDFAQLEIAEQTSIASSLYAAPGSVAPRPDQSAIVARLSALPPGRAFNRAYIRGQIAGHKELLALNTYYAQSGIDPRAQAVAQVSIPTIETHLAILYRLRAGIAAV